MALGGRDMGRGEPGANRIEACPPCRASPPAVIFVRRDFPKSPEGPGLQKANGDISKVVALRGPGYLTWQSWPPDLIPLKARWTGRREEAESLTIRRTFAGKEDLEKIPSFPGQPAGAVTSRQSCPQGRGCVSRRWVCGPAAGVTVVSGMILPGTNNCCRHPYPATLERLERGDIDGKGGLGRYYVALCSIVSSRHNLMGTACSYPQIGVLPYLSLCKFLRNAIFSGLSHHRIGRGLDSSGESSERMLKRYTDGCKTRKGLCITEAFSILFILFV